MDASCGRSRGTLLFAARNDARRLRRVQAGQQAAAEEGQRAAAGGVLPPGGVDGGARTHAAGWLHAARHQGIDSNRGK